jgi:hypothetical protein
MVTWTFDFYKIIFFMCVRYCRVLSMFVLCSLYNSNQDPLAWAVITEVTGDSGSCFWLYIKPRDVRYGGRLRFSVEMNFVGHFLLIIAHCLVLQHIPFNV